MKTLERLDQLWAEHKALMEGIAAIRKELNRKEDELDAKPEEKKRCVYNLLLPTRAAERAVTPQARRLENASDARRARRRSCRG